MDDQLAPGSFRHIPPIKRLPIEVLIAVIRLASHQPPYSVSSFGFEEDDTEEITANPAGLPLVCRIWRMASSDVIFENIRIERVDKLTLLLDRLRAEDAAGKGWWTTTLDVSIQFSGDNVASERQHIITLSNIIRHFPNLKILVYQSPYRFLANCRLDLLRPRLLIDALLQTCPYSLVRIDWHGSLLCKDFEVLVSGCSALRSLVIAHIASHGEEQSEMQWPLALSSLSIPITALPNIKLAYLWNLQVRGLLANSNLVLLAEPFLAVHANTLRSLSLIYTTPMTILEALEISCRFPRLVDLSLDLQCSSFSSINRTQHYLFHPRLERIGLLAPTYSRDVAITPANTFFSTLTTAFMSIFSTQASLPNLRSIRILNREEELAQLMTRAESEQARFIRRASTSCLEDNIGMGSFQGRPGGDKMKVTGGLRPEWWMFWRKKFAHSSVDGENPTRRHSMPSEAQLLIPSTSDIPGSSAGAMRGPVRLEDCQGRMIEPIWFHVSAIRASQPQSWGYRPGHSFFT